MKGKWMGGGGKGDAQSSEDGGSKASSCELGVQLWEGGGRESEPGGEGRDLADGN